MVEQRTHKPLVGCSNQLLGTNFKSGFRSGAAFLVSPCRLAGQSGADKLQVLFKPNKGASFATFAGKTEKQFDAGQIQRQKERKVAKLTSRLGNRAKIQSLRSWDSEAES